MPTFALALILFGSVTSQALLDIGLVLLFVFWAIRFSFKGTRDSARSLFGWIGIEWAFIGYFFAAVLSLAVNSPDPVPWLASLKKFTWLLDIYLMSWAFSKVQARPERWLWYFSLAFIIPNIYAIAGVLHGVDPLTGNAILRAVGLVDSATYHAHGNGAILVFFFALVLWAFSNQPNRLRTVMASSLVLMAASVFLTYTRGVWLSVTVSVIVTLFLWNWKVAWRFAAAYLVAFVGLIGFFEPFQKRIFAVFTGHNGDIIRGNLYRVFWEMFKEHPFVGIGYWDQYRQIEAYWPKIGLPADYFTSHAHNQFLNVLATTGLFGLFFYLAIVIYFLQENVRLYINALDGFRKAVLLACLAAQLEYHIGCLTEVTFEYAKLRVILVLVWGLLVAIRRERDGAFLKPAVRE